MNIDQYKAMQAALEFRLEHDREDMSVGDATIARAAYTALDKYIDGEAIAIEWSTEDVLSRDDTLNDQQACEVLRVAYHDWDAEAGFGWDTIDAAIGAVKA